MSKYTIESQDLGLSGDRSSWTGYSLSSYGDTLSELIDNASIEETDQDGGQFDSTPLTEHGGEVWSAAMAVIESTIEHVATIASMPTLYAAAPVLLKTLRYAEMYVDDPGNNPRRTRESVLKSIKEAMELTKLPKEAK